MKKILGAVVLAVLAVAGYFVWLEMQKTETTDDAEIDGNVVAISSSVPGYVTDVLVEDQQAVKKGDALIKLYTKDYEVTVARSRADLNEVLRDIGYFNQNVTLLDLMTNSFFMLFRKPA